MKRIALILAVTAATMVSLACGSGGDGNNAAAGRAGDPPKQVTLKLGYFPNVTHAQPIVALARGTFDQTLGPGVKLETKTFNAGPAAIEALFAGEIDAAYVGPNPTVNGFVRSRGEEVRVIAGAASGGAQLIVRDAAGINSPLDFANKKVATPQLGNTQDVALRAWLRANGLNAEEQGGNVRVIPSANADTLTLFQKGDIDAAWVPEPWGTRLIQEAGGRVFLDEKDLWEGGQFVTTNLIVTPKFLKDHADVVERLLRAQVETTAWINANPGQAKALVNRGIETLTGKALKQETIDAAWQNIAFTDDPIASSLRKGAEDAAELGFLEEAPDLSDLYDLTLLNRVLAAVGAPAVRAD